MARTDSGTSRRSFLKSAPVIAGGLAALRLSPATLAADAPGAPKKSPLAHGSAENKKIWSHEYWAQRGKVKLYMFRKRAGAPKPGDGPLPVLFLVHGSSISSRPSFDLNARPAGRIFADGQVRRLWL